MLYGHWQLYYSHQNLRFLAKILVMKLKNGLLHAITMKMKKDHFQ